MIAWLSIVPGVIIWLIGRNSFARLFGARVRHVVVLEGTFARKLAATVGGSLSSALFASALMLILFELAGALEPTPIPIVGAVTPGLPATAAGLRAGDQLLTIGGAPVVSLGDVATLIDRTRGAPTAVDVLRDGAREEVIIRAVDHGGRFRIGVELDERRERVNLPFGESVRRAARFPIDYSRTLFSSLWRTLREPSPPAHAELAGPIGIVRRVAAEEPSLDRLFTLPAIGCVHVALAGLPIGLLLLLFGRSRARAGGA